MMNVLSIIIERSNDHRRVFLVRGRQLLSPSNVSDGPVCEWAHVVTFACTTEL